MGIDELELTILMPCLNEAETLATCIVKARSYLDRSGIAGEIVIADNGSTDGSQQIAQHLGARVIPVSERGYGAAIAGGVDAARGRYVIMADADDSYDFANLDAFIAQLRGGADLVMGNRFKGGIAPGAMPWHHRYIGNPILSAVGRRFFRTPIGDFHCGLRGFSRAAFLGLNLRTTGMEFASEMVVKATLAHLDLREVPTTLAKDGRSRPPHLRSFRDGWRHLRFLLLFSPRWLFLYPGITLLAVGLVVGALLLPGPLTIGRVSFDIHTFLVAALCIIVGLQSISFAIIGRRFASRYGFIPRSGHYDKLLEALTLERILLASIALMLLGIGALVWGLGEWAARDYGDLNPSTTMRPVILALTALVSGFQMMMSGFMSSMINIPIYERRIADTPKAD
ncbi:glycosyltransferase family 2 protein [Devosia psychrophila]|uniref:Dolichol-P-glucose synthetase n=1 Tax=Devosia psychrophila TaxID=728005 RepID=A0A0F5PX12_9HYPH|nr:glycosyltransferase family 2 protein [Devosia psychrophila]KKC33202.1 dolichol-P-glucose synthetase [Devosia psychrophila]SFC27589.1 Glycosyltransferase involved in cell wall bisynthesis [Devosia psychrophila]